MAENARRDGRGDVGCIVLGRGGTRRTPYLAHHSRWCAGFIGFAVGRNDFLGFTDRLA